MDDHYIDVVNDKDEVIGRELRSAKKEKGFISRVVAVYLRDSQGRLLLCKRASHKQDDPGAYDASAVGTVNAGEGYEEAAQRELMEELGISCSLQMLGKFYLEIGGSENRRKHFCGLFLGESDAQPKLNDELVEFQRLKPEEIDEELRTSPEKFTPGLRHEFGKVKEKLLLLFGS